MGVKGLFTFVALLLSCALSQAQTAWTKHSGNPVIPAQNRYSAEPAVIYDSFEGRYKMWYSTSRDGVTQVYYATSDNGLNWTNYPDNPVLRPGEVGAWDGFHVRSSAVVLTNGLYRLYYIGSGNSGVQIGLATSEDGITWQKYEGNPVIKRGAAGTWDSHTVYHPKVVFDGSKFMMWYAGSDGAYVKGGLATSTDGVVWNKYSNNPVLLPGVAGSWDEYNVWPSSGVVFKDGIFHLLYTGVNFANPSNSPIGLAISADGIAWEKSGVNPVLQSGPVGSWDYEGLGNGSLHFDGNRFRLWYSAHDASDSWHIGYAESLIKSSECDFSLPDALAHGNLPGGDQTHADKVDYCFEGQPGALYLTFEAYDIDLQTEVKVRLNGESIFDLPITSNNAWSGLIGVLLPDELINDSGPNELSFDNLKNPPKNWRWGVRQVSVDRFYALPSTTALGRIRGGDQFHSDKVVYFFSGQPGDLDLTYAVYDIDNIHEIDILLNGVKIHDEAVTANEAWSAQRTLLLPDGLVNDTGINVLIFNNTKNPPKNWLWGVRDVSVSLAQAATLALNLSQGLSFSGVALQHASNLFDGQTRPPARPEGDDNDAADSTLAGVATIGPEGYLIVDYAAPQQFDAMMIYPEWNAQRYFRYRIEASLDGQNWQMLIDRTAVAAQGAQFVPLPQTLARFMRIRGASCVIDEASLPAGVNEQEYWQAHDALIENAAPLELALAELALLRREKTLHAGENVETLPAEFRLAQNFPNPFNPATTIRFDLPQREQVKLAVYNTMGELVQILAEGSLPAGTHTFTFDATGLASGVYLYRLQAGAFSETRKLLLMR